MIPATNASSASPAVKVSAVFGIAFLVLCCASPEPLIGRHFERSEESLAKAARAAGWKTYMNERYKYKVQYPADWDVIEAAQQTMSEAFDGKYILIENELQKVTFVEKGYEFWPGEFQMTVLSNPNHLSMEQWVGKFDIEDIGGGSLVQEKTLITLSGKPAFKLTIFGFDHQETAVISSDAQGNIFFISFEGESPNDPQFKKHLQVYEQMLGSFKFTKA